MVYKNHTYRKETVGKYFSSALKVCLIVLLMMSCKKSPSGPPDIDREDLLPSALIVSPPKIDISNSQDESDAIRNREVSADKAGDKPGTKALAGASEAKRGNIPVKTGEDTSMEKALEMPDPNTYIKGTPILFEGLGINFEGDTLDETSLNWYSDVNGELGKGHLLEKSDLDTGRHWISLVVTDNNKLQSRDSVRIQVVDAVEIVEGLMAKITSVTDGMKLLENANLILEGTGIDPEEGELSGSALSWSCNLKGELGTGKKLDVSGLLSPGEHTIVLTATNSNGDTATDSVDISIEKTVEDIVNELPVAEIISVGGIDNLLNGVNILKDVELILEGTGVDPEDGELSGSTLLWESDVDGKLGTGRELDATNILSLGDHTLTLTATDSKGTTGTDSVDIHIEKTIENIVNELPVPEIISIGGITNLLDDINVLENIKLILKGSALDPEDGELSGESLAWSSDLHGRLGTGRELDVTGVLSTGGHTITLTATDSDGEKNSISVDIIIEEFVNELPVAEITSLVDGLNVSILDNLILEGTGFDPEDGELFGNSLSWSSDINEELGTGRTLDINEARLPFGQHTIILTAEDNEGEKDTDSLEINLVNEPPEAKIKSPVDGLEISLLEDDLLELEGTGTDPEDGELHEDDNLVWTTIVDGESVELDSGTSLSIEPKDIFSVAGEYTITLTVTDSDGATHSDDVVINILSLGL